MKKDTFYFSHDYGARNDPKMLSLALEAGAAGIGIYWCLVEVLYEQGGSYPLDDRTLNTLAYSLHVTRDEVLNVIANFGLFSYDNEKFWSESVLCRLKKREDANESRRQKRLEAIARKRALDQQPRKEEAKSSILASSDTTPAEISEKIEAAPTQVQDNSKLTPSRLQDNINKGKKKKEKEIKGKETKKEINKENGFCQSEIDFEAFRKAYAGTKRGFEAEIKDFQRKQKGWKEIVPLLMPAYERMMAFREEQKNKNQFVPQLPMLKTWLFQERWSCEYGTDNNATPETKLLNVPANHNSRSNDKEERDREFKTHIVDLCTNNSPQPDVSNYY